jgi:hypothetical protein
MMIQKGVSLSLDRMDANRTFLSRNQVFLLSLSIVVVLAVTGILFLSGTATKSVDTSGLEVGAEVDSARWVAMGEFYAAEALAAERSAEANADRWAAMGEHYGAVPFDAERSAAVNTARWNAMVEHYRGDQFDAKHSAAVNTARWTAMGAHYTSDIDAISTANSARYQAMAEWYTR